MAVTEGRRVLKGKMSARACWLGVNMKQTFDIAGMTCAACKARVEKATASVDGVAEVAVNLLKNSMEVTYADESPDAVARVNAAISAAVDKAGYGAEPRAAAGEGAQPATQGGVSAAKAAREAANKKAAEAETVMRRRLIVSFVFTIPLFYLSMGHMVLVAASRVLLGPREHDYVCIHAVLAAHSRYRGELQVFQRRFQKPCAWRPQHGFAHRAWRHGIDCVRALRPFIALALEWERATSTRRTWP